MPDKVSPSPPPFQPPPDPLPPPLLSPSDEALSSSTGPPNTSRLGKPPIETPSAKPSRLEASTGRPHTRSGHKRSGGRRHTPATRQLEDDHVHAARTPHLSAHKTPSTHPNSGRAGQIPLGGAQGGEAAAQQPGGTRVNGRRECWRGLGSFRRMRLKRGGQGLARDRWPRQRQRRRLCRSLRWRERRGACCARRFCSYRSSYSCAAHAVHRVIRWRRSNPCMQRERRGQGGEEAKGASSAAKALEALAYTTTP